MNDEKQVNMTLENYLTGLEKALAGLPVSEKWDILMEIKTHIEDRLREPNTKTSEVLAALGTPETLANRYRLERGLPLVQPPKKYRWFKRLAIVLGCLFLGMLLLVGIVIYTFTPFIKIEKGTISLMGGMITIQEDAKFGIRMKDLIEQPQHHTFANPDHTMTITPSEKGSASAIGIIQTTGYTTLNVTGGAGNLTFTPSHEGTIHYTCHTEKWLLLDDDDLENIVRTEGQTITVNLKDEVPGITCDIAIPESLALTARLDSGNVTLTRLHQNQTVSVTAGNIMFSPKDISAYAISTKVQTGNRMSFPKASPRKSAPFQATLEVTTGNIMYVKP